MEIFRIWLEAQCLNKDLNIDNFESIINSYYKRKVEELTFIGASKKVE